MHRMSSIKVNVKNVKPTTTNDDFKSLSSTPMSLQNYQKRLEAMSNDSAE